MIFRWTDRLAIILPALALLIQLASCVHGFVGQATTVPIVPAGQYFTCTAISVWDGDGPIWCAEGPRIRLARINARELGGYCRPGAPCPQADGVAARDHLVELLGGETGRTADGHILIRPTRLACRSDGWGKGKRTAAWCSVGGRDLSAAMIADGYAAPWAHPHPR